MSKNHLIPLRFVSMISHLILIFFFLTDQRSKSKFCLVWDEELEKEVSDEYKIIIGLSISIFLLITEFISFLSGISMFFPSQNLFSFFLHSCGCILFFYFVTQAWHCSMFWWIFTFFSVLPFLTEVLLILRVIVFKLPY